MTRPFRSDARVCVKHWKNGGHLQKTTIHHRHSINVYLSRRVLIQTSRYIVAQPNKVIDRNIGLATLKTFNLRCWQTQHTKRTANRAQKALNDSNVILKKMYRFMETKNKDASTRERNFFKQILIMGKQTETNIVSHKNKNLRLFTSTQFR